MDTTLSEDRPTAQQPPRPTTEQHAATPKAQSGLSRMPSLDALATRYGKFAIAIAGAMVLLVVSLMFFSTRANSPTVRVVDRNLPTATTAVTITVEPIDTEAFEVQPPPVPDVSAEVLANMGRSTPPLNPNAIWVSGELGDSGNDGLTAESPYRSLQRALDEVQPGETVYVMDGKYTELWEPGNAHYSILTSGSPDAWIGIEAAPGHQPLIAPNDGSGLFIEGDYVSVKGFTVRAEGYDPDDNPWGSGIRIHQSHHVVVEDNIVSNNPAAGISSRESSNLTIANNEVFENAYWSTSQGSGISLWYGETNGNPADADGYHDRIIGNIVYRNENKVKSKWNNFERITDGNGVIIDEGKNTGYDGLTLVANNVIFDNGGRGVLVVRAGNVDVIHNTLYRNGRTEELRLNYELVANDAYNVRFINNLAWPRSDRGGIRINDVDNSETEGNVVVEQGDSGNLSKRDTVLRGEPALRNPSLDENDADFSPLPEGMLDLRTTGSYAVELEDYLGRPRADADGTAGAYVAPIDPAPNDG